MKFRIKNDYKNFYPCHCKHCKWTGSSQDVIPLESYEYDGPFYCPICLKQDPTDFDVRTTTIKGLIHYVLYRLVSILIAPAHLIIHFIKERELKNWIERSKQ